MVFNKGLNRLLKPQNPTRLAAAAWATQTSIKVCLFSCFYGCYNIACQNNAKSFVFGHLFVFAILSNIAFIHARTRNILGYKKRGLFAPYNVVCRSFLLFLVVLSTINPNIYAQNPNKIQTTALFYPNKIQTNVHFVFLYSCTTYLYNPLYIKELCRFCV